VTHQDQQVAAAAIVEGGSWLARIRDDLHALLAPVFCQARSRFMAFGYIGALLAGPGDRRSCRQLAEAAGHATPRRMQALLGEHAWDWKAALAALQAAAGRPEAVRRTPRLLESRLTDLGITPAAQTRQVAASLLSAARRRS